MNPKEQTEKTKKRRSTSIPLILGILILGGLAYYFDVGLHLMTYVMYLQENGKATSELKKAKEQNLVSAEKFEASQKDLFKSKDENNDGKLEGTEIGGQLSELDSDGDGAVSLKEFVAGPAPQGGMAKPPDGEPPATIK